MGRIRLFRRRVFRVMYAFPSTSPSPCMRTEHDSSNEMQIDRCPRPSNSTYPLLTVPAVANQRFLVGGKKYSSQIAVNALKRVPELKGRLPKDGDEVEKSARFEDVEEWNEKLGLKLRSAEETFGDAARRILELERELK